MPVYIRNNRHVYTCKNAHTHTNAYVNVQCTYIYRHIYVKMCVYTHTTHTRNCEFTLISQIPISKRVFIFCLISFNMWKHHSQRKPCLPLITTYLFIVSILYNTTKIIRVVLPISLQKKKKKRKLLKKSLVFVSISSSYS